MNTYTNKIEATQAFRQFNKAMKIIRERYTKPGQADRIIERMIVDKFGDVDISILISEFASGKYDVIVGRIRQADYARADSRKISEQNKESLLAEMTALYCGVSA